MSLSEALPVCLTLTEKTGFEVRERQTTWENGEADYKEKSVLQRGTTGCKGSQLSHRGPDTGNKEVQSIRRSKRSEMGRKMRSEIGTFNCMRSDGAASEVVQPW